MCLEINHLPTDWEVTTDSSIFVVAYAHFWVVV